MKKMMIDAATILFDDSKNDMRALSKTVRSIANCIVICLV